MNNIINNNKKKINGNNINNAKNIYSWGNANLPKLNYNDKKRYKNNNINNI